MKKYELRVLHWFSNTEGVDISLEAHSDLQAIADGKKYISSPEFYAREDVNPGTLTIISSKEI